MKSHFERTVPERPPPNVRVALAFEPKYDRLLLACDDARREATEVWELRDEGGFTRIVAGAVPHPSEEEARIEGPPVAWLAPSGEVTIARIARDGLRTFRPSAPHHVTFLPFDFGDAVAWVPEAHAAWIAKIDAAVVLVCSSNEANAYVVRDGVITDAGVAPYLHAFAPVEDAGVAVGYDIDGTLWAFDGEAFYEVAEDGKLHGLAWYPPLSTIVSLRPAGEDRLVLAAWQDEGFVDVEPEIATTTYRSGGRLAVTRDLRIVYYGGQDFEKQGSPTSSALVSAPGGTTMERDDLAGPRFGEYVTGITTRTRLVVADHSSRTWWTPEGTSAWRPIAKVEAGNVTDARYLNFAASDTALFVLDGKGALLSAADGGTFLEIAPANGGPGPRYSGRVGFAWDAPSSRVVVFGDTECNTTWVAGTSTGGFLELRPKTPPPHGVGSMVSTDAGVYLLVDSELHRLVDLQWACVASAVPGHILLWDPARDRLMTVGWDHDTKKDALWVIDAAGLPHRVANLPGNKRFASARSGGALIAVDPANDRVLVIDDTDVLALALGSVDVEARGLPRSEKSMPARRLSTPPPAWTRPALHVSLGKEMATPAIDVKGELRAILPAHPEVLPLPKGFVAIAISETEWWNGSGDKPWELGGGGVYGRLIAEGELDGESTALVVVSEGRARALSLERYVEVDVAHVAEVDTPPGPSYRWARGSKLGGYPRFVQDDPTKRHEGPPLRFVGQIGGKILPVGDAGYLFVWIDEVEGASRPQVYVVSQSH
ncbi:MAG: hypothetical protein IPK71_06980 [Myxococcales bacterium]|nr:hypothetical protein [Myxococcales bacterium]